MTLFKCHRLVVLLLSMLAESVISEKTPVKLLFLVEDDGDYLQDHFAAPFEKLKEIYGDLQLEKEFLFTNRLEVNDTLEKLCSQIDSGVSVIIELTRAPWEPIRELTAKVDVPHVYADVTIFPFVQAAWRFLNWRSASEAILLFNSERDIYDALYYALSMPTMRIITVNIQNDVEFKNLSLRKKKHQQYVLFGSTKEIIRAYKRLLDANLVEEHDAWTLVFTDFLYPTFPLDLLNIDVFWVTMSIEYCCEVRGLEDGCFCKNIQVVREWLTTIGQMVLDGLLYMKSNGLDISPLRGVKCNASLVTREGPLRSATLVTYLRNMETKNGMIYHSLPPQADKFFADPQMEVVKLSSSLGTVTRLAVTRRSGRDRRDSTFSQSLKIDKWHRIGTTESMPWSFMVRDPVTNEIMLDDEGKPIWDGYCIEMLKGLAELLKIKYEIVTPRTGTFGRLVNGSWDGLVGDLITGRIDMIFAPLTITAEREEEIDFVNPFFDQSGIWIVTRKPVQGNSVFKFMTVLKLEVWLSIVGVLIVTSLMIWFLDRYSPYSARNNKKLYPYETRSFTLKESFWFTLTSFTSQGGGEVPKAPSARALVAAYWLFVVLMLATFTANLAAFLTVERMKTTVQSLEELVAQDKVKYTMAENSTALQYFKNMASAEDELFEMWKNLTLRGNVKHPRYQVWDYPIREIYGKVLEASIQEGLAANLSDGLRRVLEQEDGHFAFIHDSAQLRYEVARNCNLTGVGEVFGSRPYSIAVQRKSQFLTEASRLLMKLQRNRFFEGLRNKYWKESTPLECDDDNADSGISLRSLGGVFIAAVFGLFLAFVTLSLEVLWYRRKNMKIKDVALKKKNYDSASAAFQRKRRASNVDIYSIYSKAEVF